MNVLTIARLTLKEAVSRRLILAGVLLSLAFLALFAAGFMFLFSKTQENARNPVQAQAIFGAVQTVMGLYAVNFLGNLLALFLAVGAISGEIDSGTIQALMARPIRRAEYVVGRWLAYAALIGLYVALMAAAMFGLAGAIAGYESPRPVTALALMALGAVTLLSVSLLGSTRLPTLANGIVVLSLFGLAWLAGIIEYIGAALHNDGMVNLGIAVSLLVPGDALWRAASYYVQSPSVLALGGAAGNTGLGGVPFVSASPPTAAFVAWGLAHPLVVLLATVWSFQRRDL